ncbi:MAG TPA: PP2C family protein-serine/threonine phosphatase, partial [Spirochaetota bacterium]|nr:PP2C family protein-serine/threonine phosphatase [Spirochaetota bacterium]
IARKIQFRLIPTEKIEGAHFHYRPMDKVGGDFFDFVRFRDRDKLGVFISDVSGHGVPAAFITAIVKSLVLQAGSRKDDPAALLKYLNDVLLGMTGDNFVTAFYAVYDRGTRALRYANAGHNPPYLIINGSFVRLESTTGPPVAIFSNERLARANKEYETNEIAIQERGKLLLYTDGVTEAVCKPSPGPMFGDGHFERAIEKHADLPSDELIEALYGELVGFRGGDSFEDDVCLVCIDV